MKITNDFIIETTTKALISLIPFAGGSVSSILADVMAERKQQRLNDFLLQLREDLEKCQDKVKTDFVQKDDFQDVFELTARKIMEERNEIKRCAYKNILVNGVTHDSSSFDEIEQCVRLVENTTENNIYLLKVLSDPEAHNSSLSNSVSKTDGNMATTTISRVLQKLLIGWQGGDVLENLKDLEFIGLIRPLSNSFQDMIRANGLTPITNSLTLKGERFIRYLKNQ